MILYEEIGKAVLFPGHLLITEIGIRYLFSLFIYHFHIRVAKQGTGLSISLFRFLQSLCQGGNLIGKAKVILIRKEYIFHLLIGKIRNCLICKSRKNHQEMLPCRAGNLPLIIKKNFFSAFFLCLLQNLPCTIGRSVIGKKEQKFSRIILSEQGLNLLSQVFFAIIRTQDNDLQNSLQTECFRFLFRSMIFASFPLYRIALSSQFLLSGISFIKQCFQQYNRLENINQQLLNPSNRQIFTVIQSLRCLPDFFSFH